MVQWISTEKEFFDLVIESQCEICYLFKHSTSCPISSRALNEITQFSNEEKSDNFFGVKVIENRSVSNFIEDYFSVRHETPQLICIKNGKVSFHISHFAISKESIQNQLAK